MAVLGVGIDLVPASRLGELLSRHGERALRRLFTDSERERAKGYADPSLHLAARVAAKEAAYKALSAMVVRMGSAGRISKCAVSRTVAPAWYSTARPSGA